MHVMSVVLTLDSKTLAASYSGGTIPEANADRMRECLDQRRFRYLPFQYLQALR